MSLVRVDRPTSGLVQPTSAQQRQNNLVQKREKMHFSQMLLKLVSNQSKTLIVEEGRFLSIETKYSPFTKFITYNVPGSRCGRPSTSAQDGSAIQCKKREEKDAFCQLTLKLQIPSNTNSWRREYLMLFLPLLITIQIWQILER